MSLYALPVSVSDLETLQQGIECYTNAPEATTEAALITTGTATVASYAQQLINNNISALQEIEWVIFGHFRSPAACM
jgi:hypothetical protein